MQAAIDQFKTNSTYVRDLGSIYKALRAQVTGAIDLSGILRAQLVMSVSALDHYIHEIVRLGMLQIYQGKRAETPAFLRFSISLESVRQGINTPTSCDWLEAEIRLRHGWQSFQHADKIAEAVRLISPVKLWEEVSKQLGIDPQDTRRRLNLIIDRRNKIAHEADMDPTFPGLRWPINDILVDQSIDFIEEVAEAIYRVL
jgi:RiboL-PSP-HEPN